MANELVMLFSDDDGERYDEPVWHLVDPANPAGPATLCTGEFFGLGESSCEYETKVVKRGGITCDKCINALIAYKAVRL